jgi:hypothetical protein
MAATLARASPAASLTASSQRRLKVQATFDITDIPLELDRREGDGISVSLFWRRTGNVVSIAVYDERTGDDFELVVAPDRALDAFRHPYAYAAREGVLQEQTVREPIYA